MMRVLDWLWYRRQHKEMQPVVGVEIEAALRRLRVLATEASDRERSDPNYAAAEWVDRFHTIDTCLSDGYPAPESWRGGWKR